MCVICTVMYWLGCCGGWVVISNKEKGSTKGKKMDCATLQQPVAEVRVNLQDFNH